VVRGRLSRRAALRAVRFVHLHALLAETGRANLQQGDCRLQGGQTTRSGLPLVPRLVEVDGGMTSAPSDGQSSVDLSQCGRGRLHVRVTSKAV